MSASIVADPGLLRDLVIANRILAREGVLDALGHVSVRHPDDASRYIIPRSLSPERVTESDLQCFTLEGEQVSGNDRTPYAERAIHGAIYEARPEVMAVCHNHSPSVIPFGVTGVPLRAIFHMGGQLGTGVPIWDISKEFGDTDLLVRKLEQGRALARTLGDHRIALMRGHGSVVVGYNLRQVTLGAVYMEVNARLQLQAMALGQVHFLSPGEAALAGQMCDSPLVLERTWDCWVQRVAYAGQTEA